MADKDNLPIIGFESQGQWEAWLQENHGEQGGVWLKLAKKGSGLPAFSYAEALESALCYGWIDGHKVAFDQQYWLQKFTPRRARSIWSQVNCAKATQLIETGRMQPAGLRAVELAKADGRWDVAYASQSKMTVPDDLQRELDNNEQARDFFATLDSTNRYAILFRIQTAKKAETRAARIRKFVDMLAKHEKIYPR